MKSLFNNSFKLNVYQIVRVTTIESHLSYNLYKNIMFSATDFLKNVPIIICTLLPLAMYLWLKHRSTFWKRHNVPHIPALPLLGNFMNLVKQTESPPGQFQVFYNDPNIKDAPFGGFHIFHKPAILVRDPELVKQILVKDFNAFSDRYN